jgi:hypothetical protein
MRLVWLEYPGESGGFAFLVSYSPAGAGYFGFLAKFFHLGVKRWGWLLDGYEATRGKVDEAKFQWGF